MIILQQAYRATREGVTILQFHTIYTTNENFEIHRKCIAINESFSGYSLSSVIISKQTFRLKPLG